MISRLLLASKPNLKITCIRLLLQRLPDSLYSCSGLSVERCMSFILWNIDTLHRFPTPRQPLLPRGPPRRRARRPRNRAAVAKPVVRALLEMAADDVAQCLGPSERASSRGLSGRTALAISTQGIGLRPQPLGWCLPARWAGGRFSDRLQGYFVTSLWWVSRKMASATPLAPGIEILGYRRWSPPGPRFRSPGSRRDYRG
jgi:hypothetical protein